jgi:hypothetical protein
MYFGKYSAHNDPADTTEARAMLATKRSPELFSTATTAALVTAAIAGTGTAPLVVRIAGADALPLAYPIGIAAFAALMVLFVRYERLVANQADSDLPGLGVDASSGSAARHSGTDCWNRLVLVKAFIAAEGCA